MVYDIAIKPSVPITADRATFAVRSFSYGGIGKRLPRLRVGIWVSERAILAKE